MTFKAQSYFSISALLLDQEANVEAARSYLCSWCPHSSTRLIVGHEGCVSLLLAKLLVR